MRVYILTIILLVMLVCAMAGLIPLWSVLVYGLVVTALIFRDYSVPIQHYFMWTAFGNRLKAGYSAKFGGSNSAFTEEVDQHINAVRALGKGYTKTLNIEKLKTISKFVEVPFVIPEEERLSEEAKVKEFKNGDECL